MTKRTLIWLSVSVLALVLIGLPAFAQPEPPAFTDDNFASPQRPPSRFDHDAHGDYDVSSNCYACHHLYEDGKLVPEESSEDQRCSECHAVESKDGAPNLLEAYHGLCKKCHEDQKAGPITCGECHVRE